MTTTSIAPLTEFLTRLADRGSAKILELGTRAWDGRPPVSLKERLLRANPSLTHVGVDVLEGEGVDVVADAHRLSEVFAAGEFDGFAAASVLEHLARPWVAAVELGKVVKPGGIGFVQTHQTFPLHGYPRDYFRFSLEALAEVFSAEAGWRVVSAGYLFPCAITPLENHVHASGWNFEAKAWLNAEAMVERL